MNDVSLDAIIQLVADVLEIPAGDLGPDTQGVDLAAWDSFGQVRIVLAAEAQFGVSLSLAEIETAGSIGGLLAAVQTSAARARRQ